MRVTSTADIGALVRSERQKQGWSQRELADRVGVSAVWVSQIENGKATAHFGLILQTLKTLEVPLWAGALPSNSSPSDSSPSDSSPSDSSPSDSSQSGSVVDLDSLVEP